MNAPQTFALSLALALGMLIALAELVSKFQDEPFKIIASYKTAWLYILLNMGVAGIAFYVLIKTDFFGKTEVDLIKAAAMAGVGSTMLMRSKFLKVNINGKETAVGPEMIIDVFLDSLERRIDRERALVRKQLVETTMDGIDFDKARDYVITTILASSQTSSEETTKNLIAEAEKITASEVDNRDKSYALGYLILDMMGENFLENIFSASLKSRFTHRTTTDENSS